MSLCPFLQDGNMPPWKFDLHFVPPGAISIHPRIKKKQENQKPGSPLSALGMTDHRSKTRVICAKWVREKKEEIWSTVAPRLQADLPRKDDRKVQLVQYSSP